MPASDRETDENHGNLSTNHGVKIRNRHLRNTNCKSYRLKAARLSDGTTRRAEVSYQAEVCGRISKLDIKCPVDIKLTLHYSIFHTLGRMLRIYDAT